MSDERDQAAPGRLVSSDPAVLRALAHPLRVELLTALDERDEATATELAAIVGDTASNCSFHLRQLAKAGFIERGERRGTAHPWRAVHRSRDLRPNPEDPASVRASATIAATYVQHEANRISEFLQMDFGSDAEWIDTVLVNNTGFWATADETRELVERITSLADHLQGREGDPSLRPPGSRKVRLFAAMNPDPNAPPTPDAVAD